MKVLAVETRFYSWQGVFTPLWLLLQNGMVPYMKNHNPSRQTNGVTTAAKTSAIPTASASRQIANHSIAVFAYSIWEKAGHPQGQEVEHWLQAESQLTWFPVVPGLI